MNGWHAQAQLHRAPACTGNLMAALRLAMPLCDSLSGVLVFGETVTADAIGRTQGKKDKQDVEWAEHGLEEA